MTDFRHAQIVGGLIEHFGGAFPTWCAPIQAVVLPITSEQADYAAEVDDTLARPEGPKD